MAPVKSTRLLYDKLIQEKIPALLHILPQSDHAFDLFLTSIAPAAHNAIYDVERFIALVSNRIDEQHALTTKKTGTRMKKESSIIWSNKLCRNYPAIHLWSNWTELHSGQKINNEPIVHVTHCGMEDE